MDHACGHEGVGRHGNVPRWERNFVTDQQALSVTLVPHFRTSEYRKFDIRDIISSYVYQYVEPLRELGVLPRSIADIGSGYGWLAIAFALTTEAKIFAVEYDQERLAAARCIAGILGVEDRIEWTVGSIADLPFQERSMDAVYCIEVIEHTGVEQAFVKELVRIANDVLVISTPNQLFPVINHDTALPFCHWLPLSKRDAYANLFGRGPWQSGNLFWTPSRLFSGLGDFTRVSKFLHFSSHQAYRDAQSQVRLGPGGRMRKLMNMYFAAISHLGARAVYFMPNLASTFRRIQ